jgi:hypothetical protein
MSNFYNQFKMCDECGYEDQREIPAEIAAFAKRREWTSACPKCGSEEIASGGVEIPAPTRELMEVWAKDTSLLFYEQDEDLCLADEANIALLLEFLDSNTTLPSKRSKLLSTLCILIYDNAPEKPEDAPYNNSEIANSVTAELKQRIRLFAELDTRLIMDYIKKRVYPRIGIPLTGV